MPVLPGGPRQQMLHLAPVGILQPCHQLLRILPRQSGHDPAITRDQHLVVLRNATGEHIFIEPVSCVVGQNRDTSPVRMDDRVSVPMRVRR